MPTEFVPAKLAEAGAIAKEELSQIAWTALVPNQAVEYQFSWGRLFAVSDRFTIETQQVPFVRVADLALKCMREVASRAVVSRFGINFVCHFRLNRSQDRDRMGQRLVPLKNWGKWGSTVEESLSFPAQDPRHGGMMTVVVRQGKPEDRDAGWIDVKIEPSMVIADGQGVLIAVNDHYESHLVHSHRLNDNFEERTRKESDALLTQLEQSFDSSIDRAEKIMNDILSGG